MTPLTRKENYLNEIVGWGETAPEKPLTPEEFFFAAILGEAVQTPEPLSRYQIYLAKIAGRNISVPKPLTRLELFLAKACGMDIETPTPITREEIFWSNYTAIVDFEVEGVSPLTYKAIEGTLENYRIYGNTVSGESVGDLVESGEHAGEYKVPVTVEGKNLLQNTATSQTINGVTFTVNSDRSVTCNGTATQTAVHILNNTFSLEPGTYNLTGCPAGGGYVDKYKMDVVIPPIAYGTDIGDGSSFTLSSTLTNALYRIIIYAGQTCNNLTFYPMIRKADIEDDTYEPYHAPVTTPIYLPEQIRKAGDDAEYIDFAEQKMHRIGADDIDVTLPALPTLTGTNVLSVGTAVQPSKVYVKYKGERQ